MGQLFCFAIFCDCFVMGSASSSSLRLPCKLLCLCLLYLCLSLYLALNPSLRTRCSFKFKPHNPDLIQQPLFTYPKSYGEHKYAIPTFRSSCDFSVNFSDYRMVLKEIQDLCMNSSTFSPVLRYLSKSGDTFAGNFSTEERKFYFNHSDDQVEVPCGFMKDFPVEDSDRTAMEQCRVVVVSAIFHNHDKIRQPKGLGGKTLQTVCFVMFIDDFTFNGLNSHNITTDDKRENKIGAWRIVRVSGELPYENPAMNAVIPKYLIHRLFPNSLFSIWLDAKLQLTVDPLLLLHSLVISQKVDMALSKHPSNVHTMEEAMATARWKKWGDIQSLKLQMETYCENGLQPWTPNKLPYTTDVPDTALILRKHGVASNLFSCMLFNELEAFNPRDQLGFAYVRDLMKPKIKMNMFEVEVFEHIAVEFRHNLEGEKGPLGVKGERASYEAVNESRCHGYLMKMWVG